MKTIKKSKLKELFTKLDISEGIFDLFVSKKNKLKKSLENDLNNIKNKIEKTINGAPTQKEKDQLRRLANAFDKAYSTGK
jgi:NAD-specific glutamate dehydrogenase